MGSVRRREPAADEAAGEAAADSDGPDGDAAAARSPSELVHEFRDDASELLAAFAELDEAGKGFITADDVRRQMAAGDAGDGLTARTPPSAPDGIDELLFAEAPDGRVTFEQFAEIMLRQ